MADHLRFERQGRLFHIDIDLPLAPSKAKSIAEVVTQDAGLTSIDIGKEKRLHRLTACGLVQPSTMRQVIDELAR